MRPVDFRSGDPVLKRFNFLNSDFSLELSWLAQQNFFARRHKNWEKYYIKLERVVPWIEKIKLQYYVDSQQNFFPFFSELFYLEKRPQITRCLKIKTILVDSG